MLSYNLLEFRARRVAGCPAKALFRATSAARAAVARYRGNPRSRIGRPASRHGPGRRPFAPAVPVEPATPSASRPAGCGLWAGLIHLQIAPTDFFSVEAGNSFRCFRIVGHFHKCESAGSSRFTVRRNVDTRNLPEWFKQRAQIRLGRLKTHVADE